MKKLGFTLAEVLITLGIIGVVAAMTIPNLIANTNGAKFRAGFKKGISTLNQAGLMAQAQYDFDYAGTSSTCADADSDGKTDVQHHPESIMSFCAILNGTLTGQTYVGTADQLTRNSNGASVDYAWVGDTRLGAPADYTAYTLADGSIVGFKSGAKECELAIGTQLNNDVLKEGGDLVNCIGFIDVNGVTLPNKEVSCSDGTDTGLTPDVPCAVKNDANHMTDVFPIVFHDATVEPASNAAKYVLTSSK